jgi:hypothetical protein
MLIRVHSYARFQLHKHESLGLILFDINDRKATAADTKALHASIKFSRRMTADTGIPSYMKPSWLAFEPMVDISGVPESSIPIFAYTPAGLKASQEKKCFIDQGGHRKAAGKLLAADFDKGIKTATKQLATATAAFKKVEDDMGKPEKYTAAQDKRDKAQVKLDDLLAEQTRVSMFIMRILDHGMSHHVFMRVYDVHPFLDELEKLSEPERNLVRVFLSRNEDRAIVKETEEDFMIELVRKYTAGIEADRQAERDRDGSALRATKPDERITTAQAAPLAAIMAAVKASRGPMSNINSHPIVLEHLVDLALCGRHFRGSQALTFERLHQQCRQSFSVRDTVHFVDPGLTGF